MVNDGATWRAYDCRSILDVKNVRSPEGETQYMVRLGRTGEARDLLCTHVLGFFPLPARDIRPLPDVLRDRLTGTEEPPWGVGFVENRICLLYR